MIVFGEPVGARQGAGFDLAAIGGHRQIGDGGILGLAGTVRHNGGITRLVGHGEGLQGLAQGANLVNLHQDGISDAVFNALGQSRRIGDENIIPHQLYFLAQRLGQRLPAVPIVLGHAVLDGDDGIAHHQVLVIGDHAVDIEGLALAL